MQHVLKLVFNTVNSVYKVGSGQLLRSAGHYAQASGTKLGKDVSCIYVVWTKFHVKWDFLVAMVAAIIIVPSLKQFDGTGFSDCEFRLKVRLEREQYLEALCERISEMAENEFKKIDLKAWDITVQFVTDSALGAINMKTSVRDIFSALKMTHTRQGNLANFLDIFLQKVQEIHATGAIYDDEEVISQLLIAMPKSYQAVTTSTDVLFSQTPQAVTIERNMNYGKNKQNHCDCGNMYSKKCFCVHDGKDKEEIAFSSTGKEEAAIISNLLYNLISIPKIENEGFTAIFQCGAVRIVKNACIEGKKLGNMYAIRLYPTMNHAANLTREDDLFLIQTNMQFLEIVSSDVAGPITLNRGGIEQKVLQLESRIRIEKKCYFDIPTHLPLQFEDFHMTMLVALSVGSLPMENPTTSENVVEAKEGWEVAIAEELENHARNKTWELVPCPPNVNKSGITDDTKEEQRDFSGEVVNPPETTTMTGTGPSQVPCTYARMDLNGGRGGGAGCGEAVTREVQGGKVYEVCGPAWRGRQEKLNCTQMRSPHGNMTSTPTSSVEFGGPRRVHAFRIAGEPHRFHVLFDSNLKTVVEIACTQLSECTMCEMSEARGHASSPGTVTTPLKEVQCWDMEIGCAQPARSVYFIFSLWFKQARADRISMQRVLPATLLVEGRLLPQVDVSDAVYLLVRLHGPLHGTEIRHKPQTVGLHPELQLQHIPHSSSLPHTPTIPFLVVVALLYVYIRKLAVPDPQYGRPSDVAPAHEVVERAAEKELQFCGSAGTYIHLFMGLAGVVPPSVGGAIVWCHLLGRDGNRLLRYVGLRRQRELTCSAGQPDWLLSHGEGGGGGGGWLTSDIMTKTILTNVSMDAKGRAGRMTSPHLHVSSRHPRRGWNHERLAIRAYQYVPWKGASTDTSVKSMHERAHERAIYSAEHMKTPSKVAFWTHVQEDLGLNPGLAISNLVFHGFPNRQLTWMGRDWKKTGGEATATTLLGESNEGDVRQVWNHTGIQGHVNGRSPRKPPDQRHTLARFPHAEIQERLRWESNLGSVISQPSASREGTVAHRGARMRQAELAPTVTGKPCRIPVLREMCVTSFYKSAETVLQLLPGHHQTQRAATKFENKRLHVPYFSRTMPGHMWRGMCKPSSMNSGYHYFPDLQVRLTCRQSNMSGIWLIGDLFLTVLQQPLLMLCGLAHKLHTAVVLALTWVFVQAVTPSDMCTWVVAGWMRAQKKRTAQWHDLREAAVARFSLTTAWQQESFESMGDATGSLVWAMKGCREATAGDWRSLELSNNMLKCPAADRSRDSDVTPHQRSKQREMLATTTYKFHQQSSQGKSSAPSKLEGWPVGGAVQAPHDSRPWIVMRLSYGRDSRSVTVALECCSNVSFHCAARVWGCTDASPLLSASDPGRWLIVGSVECTVCWDTPMCLVKDWVTQPFLSRSVPLGPFRGEFLNEKGASPLLKLNIVSWRALCGGKQPSRQFLLVVSTGYLILPPPPPPCFQRPADQRSTPPLGRAHTERDDGAQMAEDDMAVASRLFNYVGGEVLGMPLWLTATEVKLDDSGEPVLLILLEDSMAVLEMARTPFIFIHASRHQPGDSSSDDISDVEISLSPSRPRVVAVVLALTWVFVQAVRSKGYVHVGRGWTDASSAKSDGVME
ncbi:hypothetical protein PR048_029917 [Dryococelus australis]|uniref:Uncharacterized protein n=1 Tax=Dryococelus australis TaxID=614101 RepID=A0ABQ9G7H9_9NEOP|nr:hypothetical protein PR048_029917 [Dryococelus australis]